MLEILIGTAKFLVSKGFRDTIRELLQFAKASPEWKREIVPFEMTVRKSDKELITEFSKAVRLKMGQQKFSQAIITEVLTCFQELADNGFLHGCATDSDSVTVRAVVFDAGVSVEVVNNNKSKKLPSREEIKKAGQSGVTGHGLQLVLDHADHIDVTHDGRGLKFVMYRKVDTHHLEEEGLTFVHLGVFTTEVADKIERRLKGRAGDVIIVFGHGLPSHSPSSVRRAAGEVEEKEFVGRFAMVVDPEYLRFLADMRSQFPKLVGFFASPEDAIAALRPRSQRESKVTNSTRSKAQPRA
jgi:anti-sigma regulatory factor (Ser/Thr protein kinase)